MRYDASTDTYLLGLDPSGDALPNRSRRPATLLLDVQGHLVGVDLGGEGLARTVVMLGAHESVHSQREAEVEVSGGEVRVVGARALLPVGELNPYAS